MSINNMGNTININRYTPIIKKFANNGVSNDNIKSTKSFSDSVKNKIAENDIRVENKNSMTMEEYKEYIRDKIENIPLHPSQMLASISVEISDKGFEAMKNDPEYEKWVLDSLESNFKFRDPWCSICGGSYNYHYFGASKNEYRGFGYYEGYQGAKGKKIWEDKSKNSFWSRRAEMKKKQQEYEEKIAKKKHLEDKEIARINAIKRANSRALSQYYMQKAMMKYGEIINYPNIITPNANIPSLFDAEDILSMFINPM